MCLNAKYALIRSPYAERFVAVLFLAVPQITAICAPCRATLVRVLLVLRARYYVAVVGAVRKMFPASSWLTWLKFFASVAAIRNVNVDGKLESNL